MKDQTAYRAERPREVLPTSRNQDAKGEPFVGAAGQFLNRIFQKAGLQREDVYIANLLKCRPPDNRDPSPAEIRSHMPFLESQLNIIRPKVIVTLGRFATARLSWQMGPMGELLKRTDLLYKTKDDQLSIPIHPLYHPSYLLRMARGKRPLAQALTKDCIARLIKVRESV